MADLLAARRRVRGDERRAGDDLARRAEAALKRVGADERVDERMVAKPFDRRHFPTVDGMDERQAREDGHAFELDGAGAAVALVARDLRAGQSQPLAKHLGERRPNLRVEGELLAVDP